MRLINALTKEKHPEAKSRLRCTFESGAASRKPLDMPTRTSHIVIPCIKAELPLGHICSCFSQEVLLAQSTKYDQSGCPKVYRYATVCRSFLQDLVVLIVDRFARRGQVSKLLRCRLLRKGHESWQLPQVSLRRCCFVIERVWFHVT